MEDERMRECTWLDLTKTKAAEDVLKERLRQITVEGWNAAYDDELRADGELAQAAACYAWHATEAKPPLLWPWDDKWWKPGNRRRELVKAAALLIAEIERLDRMEVTPNVPHNRPAEAEGRSEPTA